MQNAQISTVLIMVLSIRSNRQRTFGCTYIAGHEALATDDTRFPIEIYFSLNNKTSATGSNFAPIGVNLARENYPAESTCHGHVNGTLIANIMVF